MSTARSIFTQQSSIRLFDPESLDSGGLRPSMPLSGFFASWFRPVWLEGQQQASPGTVLKYEDAVRWWCSITADPPLEQIDDVVLARFSKGLREARYRRGKLSVPRPLAAWTIAGHQSRIRTILQRTGPTLDPRRPGKKLVAEVPYLRVVTPADGRPKPAFSLDEARAIFAAAALPGAGCTRGRRPPMHPQFLAAYQGQTALWWQAMLAVLYYAGIRSGDALLLTTADVRPGPEIDRPAGTEWLDLAAAQKTGKPLLRFLHPHAAGLLRQLKRPGSTALFPWPHAYSCFVDLHERLQALAGLPAERRRSPHAWRRTYGTAMARLGAQAGLRVAQLALDHADARTTAAHYVDLEAELIARLPPLSG